jgi:hypothetical protein
MADSIEQLVAHRTDDILTFVDEIVECGDDLPRKVESAIKGMVNKIECEPEYKRDKIDKIKYTLHNNV